MGLHPKRNWCDPHRTARLYLHGEYTDLHHGDGVHLLGDDNQLRVLGSTS